jgi:mannose-6-phosphate isomerase
MNKTELYPLKFTPIFKSMIWGGSDIHKFKNIDSSQNDIGESWEISGVEGNISKVCNGSLTGKGLDELIDSYKGELLGESIYNKYGNTFPLLIKFIDARQDLSIQVHPNDTLAKQRHNSFGKTEMWYVVKAAPHASLYTGFKKQITPDDYVKTVENNTFVDTLMKYDVHQGDVFYLPAGRVHAIGAGCFVAEIQQTSNITYRIYDYNRKDAQGNTRELHTELAKDAIDYTVLPDYKTNYEKATNKPVSLVTSDYFKTNLLELNKPFNKDLAEADSFTIYICIEGSCTVEDDKGNNAVIKQGETILIPACTKSVQITPDSNCKLLETKPL